MASWSSAAESGKDQPPSVNRGVALVTSLVLARSMVGVRSKYNSDGRVSMEAVCPEWFITCPYAVLMLILLKVSPVPSVSQNGKPRSRSAARSQSCEEQPLLTACYQFCNMAEYCWQTTGYHYFVGR